MGFLKRLMRYFDKPFDAESARRLSRANRVVNNGKLIRLALKEVKSDCELGMKSTYFAPPNFTLRSELDEVCDALFQLGFTCELIGESSLQSLRIRIKWEN